MPLLSHGRTVRAAAFALLAATTTMSGCSHRIHYPPSRTNDVVDDYFGVKVRDPYRWMEDLDSREVSAWVAAQDSVTFGYLATLPLRQHFKERIAQLWNYPKVSIPEREGGKLFYGRNSGLQRQTPVYMRQSLTAKPKLVIDPNALSPDGSVALAEWAPSPDAHLLAYGLSEGGADWRTVRVRDIDTGRDLPDEVKWMRFSAISWTKDAKGFFYSRYPEPPQGKALEAALSGQALYYHTVGTPQSDDRLIYQRPDLPSWFIFGSVTEDGRYLLISMAKGSDNNNRLSYVDLRNPMHPDIGAPVRPLIERDDAEFSPIGSIGPVVYLRSDLEAPNRKVIAVNLRSPAPALWKTVLPERKQVLERVALIGGRFVAQYLVDAKSQLELIGRDGKSQGVLPLPGIGTVADIGGREDTPEIFYAFSSPLYPTTVYRYDPKAKEMSTFEQARPAFDDNRYETRQLFATSKDGTRIPFFLTARKGLTLDRSHPTMMYGYGGFSISTLPTYHPDVPAWLELGGIWVTVNMRGGAEYGEAWHRAGMLEKKQNVFDDFIAVAEYLVEHQYTSPPKLGIMGGSNGGLLVGAVEEQNPDLFAVALPAVGVMDMLRYDRFTGGHAWVTEFGSSSDSAQFQYLYKYSPLQNVRDGACYPATLVTTADHDDRVVPSHSYKFTATMQAAQSCDRPILIRVETEASHGYRPTDKRIQELADEWAFTAANMGIRQAPPAPAAKKPDTVSTRRPRSGKSPS